MPNLGSSLGVPPVRIDVITKIDGVVFDEAWPERVIAVLGGEQVPVLSRRHLVANKTASGRLQDLADLEQLSLLGDDEG